MKINKSLAGKNVLIGITGGIGAYKTYNVIRELTKLGAEIKVIVTESAKAFISAVTLETFTGNAVYDTMFGAAYRASAVHIELSRWADCFLVCPATANIIGKAANGIADDLLSTTIITYDKKIIYAPAMNSTMYLNPMVQENIRKLSSLGHIFVGPDTGDLATAEEGEGIGRLIAEEAITETVRRRILSRDDLRGRRVLVTAGRTEEPIDPVRYISNRSSGRMGFAIAEEAFVRGAEVTLIAGVHEVPPPFGIQVENVQTANEMSRAVKSAWSHNDILVMAAAVADYRPAVSALKKIKRNSDEMTLELTQNDDIIAYAAKDKGSKIVVGFALETDNELAGGQDKLKRKGLNMIVINNPGESGAGFGTETNKVTIVTAGGKPEFIPLMTKEKVAGEIWDRIVRLDDF